MRPERIFDANAIPDKVPLPGQGYDATLCPNCLGQGIVIMGKQVRRDGWLLRRRACKDCGARWPTVELYVSDKRSGPAPAGNANTRYLALAVDALDGDGLGPYLATGKKEKGDAENE